MVHTTVVVAVVVGMESKFAVEVVAVDDTDYQRKVAAGVADAVETAVADMEHMTEVEVAVVAGDTGFLCKVVQVDFDDIADSIAELHQAPTDGSHRLLPLNCVTQRTNPRVMCTYKD